MSLLRHADARQPADYFHFCFYHHIFRYDAMPSHAFAMPAPCHAIIADAVVCHNTHTAMLPLRH